MYLNVLLDVTFSNTYRSSHRRCSKKCSHKFRKIHRKTKTPVRESLFNKVVGLRPATLLKKRPWHRWFPVNFVRFLRTSFLTEHLRWLLLEACLYKQFLTHISPSGNTVGTALRPKSALLCKTTLCKLCKPPQSTLRVSLGGI